MWGDWTQFWLKLGRLREFKVKVAWFAITWAVGAIIGCLFSFEVMNNNDKER